MADRSALPMQNPILIVFFSTLLLSLPFSSPHPLPDLDPAELEALGLLDEPPPDLSDDVLPDDHGSFSDYDVAGLNPEDEQDDASFASFQFDDPDVVVLASSNFSDSVSSNRFIMIEFYAPWCGHCQSLAPEYAAAATELKAVGVPLAKVDATKEAELAQEHNVEGYPTILFFVDGKPKPYSHHRTRDGIVSWVKKKIGPPVTEVTTTGGAETILETGNTIAVALFDKLEGPEVEEFASAARQEDDVIFYQTTSAKIADVFNIKQGTKSPALVVLKSATEKIVHYDGKFERVALSEFILSNKLPLVSTFSRDTATAIFESSITKQLLLFATPGELGKVLPAYEEAAKSFKGKIIFVYVESSDEEIGKPIVEFFGVTTEKPTIVAFTVIDEHARKYLFEEEFTVDKIKGFATDFLGGKLKELYKSEPVPETNNGDVKVVVGKNFDELVLDESKDVLLEIYAPWCGHCQALEPIYEKLATALKNVDSLVLAKMDGTANEHPRGKAEGYPTLLFFPAGNKTFDPIPVDSERSVKGLYQFLKQNAAIPFTLSKASKPEETIVEVGTSTSTEDEIKDEL